MARLFTVVLLTIWLCACKKNPYYPGQVTYTLKGQQISYGNSQLISVNRTKTNGGTSILRLYAESDDISSGFDIVLYTDSLGPGATYSDQGKYAYPLSINNFYYKGAYMAKINFASTNFTVTITRFSEGSIDATFTGRITGALSNGEGINDSVMNGTLTNVLVK